MRIFTCTPVAFGGGEDFFSRDSGLLCRGLRSLGIDSMAVMPEPARAGDLADLIRTPYVNLEDPAWWRMREADGVVLYAWGSPRFRKVARAIREAGVFLILNQDNGGLVSPLAGLRDWTREQWNLGGQGRGGGSWLRTALLLAKGLSIGLLRNDPLRAEHLRQGDVIACVSPRAADHYRRLCRIYGGGLERRISVLPHAVETTFRYDDGEKMRRVVCVGRWADGVQKRPALLMDVVGTVLSEDGESRFVIAGEPTETMREWHARLPAAIRRRVDLVGRIGRTDLAGLLRGSMVFYSPSAYESFGIAAGEALCSGCSVVAGRSVSMASFEWFTGDSSGALAERDDAGGHAMVIARELGRWGRGERNPEAISKLWRERLHADMVAAQVVELVSHAQHCSVAL